MPRFFAFVLVVLAGCSTNRMPPPTAMQQNASYHTVLSKRGGYDFLLSLPAGYQEKENKRWPLILFLHGSGERGANLALVAKHGPPKLIQAVAKKAEQPANIAAAARALTSEFIVISPQCPADQVWDDEILIALLDHMSSAYKVDASRVYLTGLSMGGYGAWSLGLKAPQRFAAIAPICGGGNMLDLIVSPTANNPALKSLPVWAFHGGRDPVVPTIESQRMVDALIRLGDKSVQLTIYPEATHDSWTATYANPELYSWFLQHQR
jgi:predicted peptidase